VRRVHVVLSVLVIFGVVVALGAWWWAQPQEAAEAFGGTLTAFDVLDRATGDAVIDGIWSGLDGRVDPQGLRPDDDDGYSDEFAVVPPPGMEAEWAAALGLDLPADPGDVLLISYLTRRTAGHRPIGVEVVDGTDVVVHLAEGRCLLPCGDEGVSVAEAIALPDHDVPTFERVVLYLIGQFERTRTYTFTLDNGR
jgi:hypothetical protein